jgi:hypothetical protein
MKVQMKEEAQSIEEPNIRTLAERLANLWKEYQTIIDLGVDGENLQGVTKEIEATNRAFKNLPTP